MTTGKRESERPKLTPMSMVFLVTMAGVWICLLITALNVGILGITLLIATPFVTMLCWEMAKEDAEITEKLRKMKG